LSMNEMNRLPYLESWCKSYFDKVGLKIHPSNVPTEVVLNDIMEQLTMLICHEKAEVTAYDALNARVTHLEKVLDMVERRSEMLVEGGNTLDERIKTLEQLKSTSTKKVK
jgi:hypothetical protein